MRLIEMKMKIIERQIIIDLDVDMDTNVQNIPCLGKIVPICNKQHLNNSLKSNATLGLR